MWPCFINSRFEFSKIAPSNNILKQKMISDEKVMNIKVVRLIKIYNFYFGHFFIRQSDTNTIHKIYISLLWFMKPYERYVKFMNNITTTLLDEQITKIKICRSWWVLQLCCCWLFQLKSFTLWKCCFKLSFFWNSNFELFKLCHMKYDQINAINW